MRRQMPGWELGRYLDYSLWEESNVGDTLMKARFSGLNKQEKTS